VPYSNHSEENLQGLLAMGGAPNNRPDEKIMVREELNNDPGSPANFERETSPRSPKGAARPDRSPQMQVKD